MSAFLWRCSSCGSGVLLLVRIGREDLCAGCWHRRGEPAPAPGTEAEAFAQIQRTRERMVERGGTARHLVRKGLT